MFVRNVKSEDSRRDVDVWSVKECWFLSLQADSGAYKASLDSALLVFADEFTSGAGNGEFDPDDMAGDFHLEQEHLQRWPRGRTEYFAALSCSMALW